jgi:hypothetical protein
MGQSDSFIERSRVGFQELIQDLGLFGASVSVQVRGLSPEEAIGRPGRRDFPLLKGKERLLEAVIGEARGHAFTDAPREFSGSVEDLLGVRLDETRNRGPYLASLNAAFRYAGRVAGTVHCRDGDPERCAREIAVEVDQRRGWERVGLVGFNPAMAEALARRVGPERLRITDLDMENIGTTRFGVPIRDGDVEEEALVGWADGVLLTGTTLVNGTFDSLWAAIQRRGIPGVLYGVTAAAMAHLFGFQRLCPCARG